MSQVDTNTNICTVQVASWRDDGWALRIIREEVFIREQHVPVELEWDALDSSCIHILALDSAGNPVGTARLLPEGVIGRMAVLKNWRRKGVGSALMLRLLEDARKRHMQQIALNAQVYARGFYARFGFQTVGDEFIDAGIPHRKMILGLDDRIA
jgi:predicted GNAT family N-acyltransferase